MFQDLVQTKAIVNICISDCDTKDIMLGPRTAFCALIVYASNK